MTTTVLLRFAVLWGFLTVSQQLQFMQNQNQGCSNKVLFWNGTIDYIVKLCKDNNNIQLDMKQYNQISSLTFPHAKYTDKKDQFEYKINFLNLTKNDIKGIADSIAVYIKCFENPFATGCSLPQNGCNALQNSGLNIGFHGKRGSLKLKCFDGIFKREPEKSRKTRGTTTQKCCPSDKDIICHGCTTVHAGGSANVSVANCPQGFSCFGSTKVTGGGGGGSLKKSIDPNAAGVDITRSLTIVHQARRLMYRQRRSTEQDNSEVELKNLYHLKVIHKALDLISKDFQKQI